MEPNVTEHYQSISGPSISTEYGVKEGVAEKTSPTLQKEADATNKAAASVLTELAGVETAEVKRASSDKGPGREGGGFSMPTILTSFTKVCKQALQMLQRLRGGGEEKPEPPILKPTADTAEVASSHYVSAKEGSESASGETSHYVSAKEGSDSEGQVSSHYTSVKGAGDVEEGVTLQYTSLDGTNKPPEETSYHYGPIGESPGQVSMSGTLDVLFDEVSKKSDISNETAAPTVEKEVSVQGKLNILGQKEIKHLNNELGLQLTDKEIKSLVKDLKLAKGEIGKGNFNPGTLKDHKFASIRLTTEGDIHAEVKKLGAGGYKVTNLAVKIGSFSPLKKGELEAKSIYKEGGDPAEIRNEQNLHKDLSSARRAGVPLGNVVVAREVKDAKTGEIAYMTEFCEGGDVEGKIKSGTLTRGEKDTIALGLCKGAKQLHDAGIVHRDLKPDNIFLKLDSKGRISEAKVGDLGKSSHTKEEAGRYHTDILPINWTAPEVMEGGEAFFDPKNDTYMQGITLYQLYAEVPTNQLNIKLSQFESPEAWTEFRGNPENWKDWDKVPPDVQGLIKDMTAPSATGRRPTDGQLVSFFSSM